MRIFIALFSVVLFAYISLNAPAKPVPVEHYARLPNIYDAAITPDGKFLATIVDNNGKYILRMFNLANPNDKKVRAIAYEDGVKVNWIRWASNEHILISTRQTEKTRGVIYSTGFLFSADKDAKDIHLVLDPAIYGSGTGGRVVIASRQFNNRVVDFLPAEPDHILMAYGKEKQSIIGVHKVNILKRKGVSQRIKRGSSQVQHWVADGRHEVRLGKGRKDGSGDNYMIIRDTLGDKWRNVKEYPSLSAATPIYGFTDNPDELVIGDYDGKDTLGLFIYSLAQKKRTRKLFQHDKYDVAGLIRSPDGKKVIGARYLADSEEKVFFDSAYKTRLAKIQSNFLGYQIKFIDQTPDGNKVVFKAGSASTPNYLFVYDFAAGTRVLIAYDYPEIGDTIQGDVTNVKYTARDGLKIPGYVTTPPKIGSGEVSLKNLPFIIMPHGGPYARDTQSFDYLAQFMASRGYAVLQMNFRGSDGYGKAFKQAGQENWVVMQEDVEDGARWLIEKGYADPERVCIVGWSYGGYAALMGAIKNPELYACSISIAGVTDLQDMVRDIKKYRFGRRAAKNFVLKGFEGRHDIKENSPVKRAKEYTVPLLLVHGKKYVTVHYDQFTRMRGALKKSGAKVTTLSFKEGDQSMTDFEDRKALFAAMDKIIDKK